MSDQIPLSLKIWFIVHFAVDTVFAIPLIFFPYSFLTFLGFTSIEPLTSRLVGAALIGIGGTSFLVRNMGVEVYQALLSLKILWSGAAIISIAFSIIEGGPAIEWLLLLIFVVFSIVWNYYKRVLLE